MPRHIRHTSTSLHPLQSAVALADMTDEMLEKHARISANLIRPIPKLNEVADIIAMQRVRYELPEVLDMGSVLPDNNTSVQQAVQASVLRIAVDYRKALIDCIYDKSKAFNNHIANKEKYDTRMIEACRKHAFDGLGASASNESRTAKNVTLDELQPGMCVREDVVSNEGKLLLAKGSPLTAVAIAKLKDLHSVARIPGVIATCCNGVEVERRAA